MIDKLTKEQESLIPEYVDKWLKIGLCTDRVNPKRAREISDYYYKKIADKKPVPVVILDSPLSAWLGVCMLAGVWSQVRSQVESQVWSQVESQVGSQVRLQVESQVRSQVRSQVGSQVESQVGSQVESQVWSQVGSQVRSQVGSQVESQVGSQVGSFIYPWLDGHFMSSFFSYFDYMNNALGIKFEVQDKYDWYQRTSEVGLIYPLENFCVISDRPTKIKMLNGRLHSENSPSVEYNDGFYIYSLNGIQMKPEYVLIPIDKIKPDTVLKEENVDMRRELLRKVGVERMMSYGNIIEESNGYKLLDMAKLFSGVRYAPFLFMRNPSIDATHLEGVSPECRTIEQAINWRAGNIEIQWQPYQLS